MPENETILHDVRAASRWRPLRERMDGGLAPTEAFPAIQDEFFAQPLNVWRQLRRCGIDAADLFAAALNDPVRLRELIRQAHHDGDAKLSQQIAHMHEPDSGIAPPSFRRYLKATNVVSSDAQLASYVEVHRRYRQEWLAPIADARNRRLPWVAQARTLAYAEGATS